jgi:glycosyltransferase involved in cell wall biosynthesis
VGVLPGQAQDFFKASIGFSAMHHAIAKEAAIDEWPLDGTSARVVAAASTNGAAPPKLSLTIVAYRSPRQIENTLYSLSTRHQRNVADDDYEIIVVENRSTDMLGEERALAVGKNIRYFLRDERGVSPAPALNFAVSEARAGLVGLMIDGARMATPRVVEHVLLAARVHPRPLIVVPGYHLGPGRQHLTSLEGYDEAAEISLLDSVDWTRSGYRLFDIGCFDEATKNGFLNPILEATYLFTSKACFDEVGGLDERFDLEGGGEVNHDLFERLSRLPNTRYVVLWGEGNFHQYHGGVSTTAADREEKLERFRAQYDKIRGHRFRTFEREPWLVGASAGNAYVPYSEAAALGRLRFGMVRDEGRAEWENG